MSERDMADLLALVEKQLGKSWVDIVDWLRQQNALDAIDEALARGDIEGVVREVQTAAERYAADVHAGYVKAGQEAASWLDDQSDSLVRFDATNERAVAWAKKNELSLVRGLTQEQRDVVRAVLTNGAQSGVNPRAMGREIQQSIGLTPSQVDAVASYRRALESGDYANALARGLSDGRSDQALQTAMRNSRPIDPERIPGMVDRYRANFVAYRAQVIARTESLRAVHGGNEELFRQAIARGDIDADQLTRTWSSAHDGRVRPSHRAMDGQERRFGKPFTTGDGVHLDYPGDPNAPVEETVQCRCVVATRFAA